MAMAVVVVVVAAVVLMVVVVLRSTAGSERELTRDVREDVKESLQYIGV